LRKSFIVAGMATLALSTASVAYAQLPEPSIDATASVSPGKAGTKSKPTAATFKLGVKNNAEAKTTAKSIEITFPSSIKVSTKGLNQCTATDDELIADVNVCKSSFAGSGKASAKLNPFAPNPSPLSFNVKPIVGKNELLFVLSGSADAVLHGKIKGKKMTIVITPTLQQPVPNVYSALNELSATIKNKKGKNALISTVDCKSKKHTIGVKVAYAPNPTAPAKPDASDSVDAKCS